MDERLFRRGIASGDFAMWWEAHDLLYGLPAELTSEVGAGRIVIANVSRGLIDQARRVFGTCHAVHITAHPDILAARLAGRAREAVPEQIRRLNRPKIRSQSGFDTEIDNGGSLIVAVDRFVDVLFAIKRGAQGHG
jgi:ribose 1,5-bisphosphokinase